MGKSTNAKVFVNNEVLEAADLNQVLTDVGNVEDTIPYDSNKIQETTGANDIGAAATPFGDIYIKDGGKINVVDVATHTISASFDPTAGGSMTWTKYTKTYAQLSAAATSNSIALFTLAAMQMIHAVVIKHTSQFAGGAISGYNISVGIAGFTARYAPNFPGVQAVANDTFDVNICGHVENFTSTTGVLVTANSVGANLDAATQGSVDIYILTSNIA